MKILGKFWNRKFINYKKIRKIRKFYWQSTYKMLYL